MSKLHPPSLNAQLGYSPEVVFNEARYAVQILCVCPLAPKAPDSVYRIPTALLVSEKNPKNRRTTTFERSTTTFETACKVKNAPNRLPRLPSKNLLDRVIFQNFLSILSFMDLEISFLYRSAYSIVVIIPFKFEIAVASLGFLRFISKIPCSNNYRIHKKPKTLPPLMSTTLILPNFLITYLPNLMYIFKLYLIFSFYTILSYPYILFKRKVISPEFLPLIKGTAYPSGRYYPGL